MSFAIVADSSCNLKNWKPAAPDTEFISVPLSIHAGTYDFVDDDALDINEMLTCVEGEKDGSSTSCPSVGSWADAFRAADNVIAITISSNLSGSYDSALTARDLVLSDDAASSRRIHVLNSRAAGGKLEVIVTLLDRYLINNPDDFTGAVAFVEDLEKHSMVLYSLSGYDNLIKSGRMPRVAGQVASMLSIRILGTASEEGIIQVVGPTRGEKKTYRKICDTMASDGYAGGLVYIDHVLNEDGARDLAKAIVNTWPNADVRVLPCRGLCSHYAEPSGLIIGYEWQNR